MDMERLKLQMDNYAGQNKNNTVIWYGLWRTMTSLHSSLECSLMEAGHTKFHPDWHFGLFKAKWRQCSAETMGQVASVVDRSSRNGHNIPQIVQDPDKLVLFFDWASHLSQLYRKIPSIPKYHQFRMCADKPGSFFVKEYASDSQRTRDWLTEEEHNMYHFRHASCN